MRAALWVAGICAVLSISISAYLYYDNKQLSAYVGACNMIFWQIERAEKRKLHP